uniref:Uncharacterized protein n=1 Tax=Globisporangium ultimum (strain ATCC 200006 / CBS 805.95 / DAOM BR144) TaxID=431595 RepID=K3X951_GLOUD
MVMCFISTGTGTTSQSMSFFLVMTNRYSPVLKNNDIETPSRKDVGYLIYLEAAIRENLHLNPPVTVTMRVVIAAYATMRLKSVWGEDALEFKSERWTEPTTVNSR